MEAKTRQEKVYRYIEKSGIAMYCIPKQLLGKYLVEDLTGNDVNDIVQFERITKRQKYEPNFERVAKAVYDFEYFMKAIKIAKKMKATYIRIEIDKNRLLRLSIAHVKDDTLKNYDEVPELKWKYYLAPYRED